MNGFLTTLFLMLVLLYAVSTQECIRVTLSAPVSVQVGWCNKKVTASLPNAIGYCSNARYKSAHKIHTTPQHLERSKYLVARVRC